MPASLTRAAVRASGVSAEPTSACVAACVRPVVTWLALEGTPAYTIEATELASTEVVTRIAPRPAQAEPIKAIARHAQRCAPGATWFGSNMMGPARNYLNA